MGRIALALVVAAGCAGAEATNAVQPGAPGPLATATNEVGINPGESMTFEVRLGGVLAGEAALAVGEIGDVDGKRAVVVKSRAATAGAVALIKKIVDEATTVIDLDTGRPMQLATHVEQGSKVTDAEATFGPTSAAVTYKRSDEPQPRSFTVKYGTQTVHDSHSAMAQVRGWKPVPGTSRSVFVVGGRRLWRVDVQLVGTETIGSALGNRRTIKFEGQSYRALPNFTIEANRPARTFTVWLTDDADRVPLKVSAHTELGDIVVDLLEYNRK